jgi:hypothetical protein
MSTSPMIYLVTITCDHEFDAVRAKRVFDGRAAATQWANEWVASQIRFDDSIDPAFGAHGYTSQVEAFEVHSA